VRSQAPPRVELASDRSSRACVEEHLTQAHERRLSAQATLSSEAHQAEATGEKSPKRRNGQERIGRWQLNKMRLAQRILRMPRRERRRRESVNERGPGLPGPREDTGHRRRRTSAPKRRFGAAEGNPQDSRLLESHVGTLTSDTSPITSFARRAGGVE